MASATHHIRLQILESKFSAMSSLHIPVEPSPAYGKYPLFRVCDTLWDAHHMDIFLLCLLGCPPMGVFLLCPLDPHHMDNSLLTKTLTPLPLWNPPFSQEPLRPPLPQHSLPLYSSLLLHHGAACLVCFYYKSHTSLPRLLSPYWNPIMLKGMPVI